MRCADNYPVLVLEIVDFVKMRTQKGVWVFLLSIRKIITFPERDMGSPGQFDRVAMNISMYIRWFGLDMKKQMGKAHDMYVFLYISCAFRSYVPSRRRTELCTIEANSFFCSEIGHFQEFGNRNNESAIEIRCGQPRQMVQ